MRQDRDLASLDLGQVEKVVHELGQSLGGLAHQAHLLLLFRGEVAVVSIQEQPAQTLNRVEGGPELVAHVGEKARLHLRRPAQRVGLFIEFSV